MSTYAQFTVHPETKRWEDALWIDDYFGRHLYGVRFPDGKVFDPDKHRMRTGQLSQKEADLLNNALILNVTVMRR